MTTRPVRHTIPTVEALEVRCLPSANGVLPPAVPVCPPPGNVTQQSGTPAGVSDQVLLIPTVSVDIVRHVHVPGRHKTVPLRPIHHGQHFQTALGVVLQVRGTGSLLSGDTPGGGEGQHIQMGFTGDLLGCTFCEVHWGKPHHRKDGITWTDGTVIGGDLKEEVVAIRVEKDGVTTTTIHNPDGTWTVTTEDKKNKKKTTTEFDKDKNPTGQTVETTDKDGKTTTTTETLARDGKWYDGNGNETSPPPKGPPPSLDPPK
jgi:hypothetical protein